MATSYNIYESTDGGDTYNYFDSVTSDQPGTDAPATTYTATGLTAGTTPLFEVTAANASGESSPATATDGTTTDTGLTVPTGVTGVGATVGTIDSSGGGGSTAIPPVTVTWTDDSGALGYLIGRTDDATPDDAPTLIDTFPAVAGQTSYSYTDTTADPDIAYTYTVQPYYSSPAPTSFNGTGTGSSSTGDDFTGTINNVQTIYNADHTQATIEWAYQGPVSGFEVETEDKTQPGTNYAYIGGATDPTTGDPYYSDVVNLAPGADLGVRFRADNSDGTVSAYASTNATGPATQPTTSTSPVVSVSAAPGTGPVSWPQGGWNGTVTTSIQNSPYADTGSGTTMSLGTCTVTLPTGQWQVFAVYDAQIKNANDPFAFPAFSPYSKDLTVTAGGPPAAPATINVTLQKDMLGAEEAHVVWQNTPATETGYMVERSIGGGPYSVIFSSTQDFTVYDDNNLPMAQLDAANSPTVSYRVVAGTPFTYVSPVATLTFSRGGPDVTKNLMAIAADFKKQVANNNMLGAFGYNWANYWEIQDLHGGSVFYPLVPPVASIPTTCTVNGKVFDDYAVNYWLAGLMYANMNPVSKAAFYTAVLGYTPLQGIISNDDAEEKVEWFDAGAAGNLSLPKQPAKYDEALPGFPYQAKLSWKVGDVMKGHD